MLNLYTENNIIRFTVTLTLGKWPCRLQVGPTCRRHGHRHRVTVTRGCIDTICLFWWWARCARNM